MGVGNQWSFKLLPRGVPTDGAGEAQRVPPNDLHVRYGRGVPYEEDAPAEKSQQQYQNKRKAREITATAPNDEALRVSVLRRFERRKRPPCADCYGESGVDDDGIVYVYDATTSCMHCSAPLCVEHTCHAILLAGDGYEERHQTKPVPIVLCRDCHREGKPITIFYRDDDEPERLQTPWSCDQQQQ